MVDINSGCIPDPLFQDLKKTFPDINYRDVVSRVDSAELQRRAGQQEVINYLARYVRPSEDAPKRSLWEKIKNKLYEVKLWVV